LIALGLGERNEAAQRPGGSRRRRSAAEPTPRGVGARSVSDAQRPQGRGVSGAGTGAPSPERSATRSGTAFKRWSAAAASVQAFQRDGGSVTARLSKRSRAARSLASARPCGPGRRERSDRSRRATNGSGIADPPRGTKRSDCRVRAAVEASPAPCRAQRRAGADSAGADVTERSAAEWRNDGDGAGWRSAVSCGPLHRTHRRPARPLPHRTERFAVERSEADGESEATDAAEEDSRARDIANAMARDVPHGSRSVVSASEPLVISLLVARHRTFAARRRLD